MMKKMILFTAMLLLPLAGIAQDYYDTFLEEGKVWHYSYHNPSGSHYNYSLFVCGDTIIGGQTYKKIYRDDLSGYQYALREEGHKVYIAWQNSEPSVLYDFSGAVGDCITFRDGTAKVTDINTVCNSGRYFRRFFLTRMEDGQQMENFCWIEGVGGYGGISAPVPYPGNYSNLTSCDIGGRLLLRQDAFNGPQATDVTYHPLLQDGKEWLFRLDMRSWEEPWEPLTMSLHEWISGDTIVDGKQYWHLYYECVPYTSNEVATVHFLLREEDRKVYGRRTFENDEETFGYDFSAEAGDVIDGIIKLQAIDTICTRGISRQRFDFGLVKWVEGVGSSHSLTRPYGQMVSNGIVHTLTECREAGKCIFTASDFSSAAITTSVIAPATDKFTVGHDKQTYFDLQGRRLTGTPRRGLYIKDGRKVVVK